MGKIRAPKGAFFVSLKRLTASPLNGFDRTASTTYWLGGEIKSKRLPAGGTTSDPGYVTGTWSYDAAGRLDAIDNTATPSATEPDVFIADMQYTPQGAVASVAYGNGAVTTYSYDPQRFWLNRVVTTQGATTLLDETYTRNDAGQIVATDLPGSAHRWTYAYDDLGRLTTATDLITSSNSLTLGYDLADNLVRNSKLCAANPNLVYPTPGSSAVRPHVPRSVCGDAPGHRRR